MIMADDTLQCSYFAVCDIPASAMNFTENQQACIVLDKLWSQRETGRFCDVVLHVQGQKFQAHRNVLAARSPYFDSVLKTQKVVKEQLMISCQNINAFQLLLNYIYRGAVVIDKNNVSDLLRLANHFLVIKLKDYCVEYLCQYLDSSNCLAVADMADEFKLTVLQKKASVFIQDHIVEVLDQNEILDFPFGKLESFLQEKQCLIPQPVLLSFICKWVEHNSRENYLRTLLTFVNWASIEHQYLEDHAKTCSLFQKNPKCMYVLLTCLEENKIELSEFKSSYAELKSQYGPFGDNDGFMNVAISAAIQGLQEYPNSAEDNTPITVAPLGKGPLKEKNSKALLLEEPNKLSSENDESTNSRFDDVVPGDGSVIDYDGPTSEPDKKESSTASNSNRRKAPPRKLVKKSPPRMVTMAPRETRSTLAQKAQIQVKFTRQSIKNANKVADQIGQPKVQADSKEIDLVSDANAAKDSDGDHDDEDSSSASDSSFKESAWHPNGNRKSKWKNGIKCPHCSYVGHSSNRLQYHVTRIHAKDITYKCCVCDLEFKWNREYYWHMNTHFEGPPFHCETCDYTCQRIQFLLTHRMIHTDERPFKCSQCDHRCRTKANLECHMRIHTGEKPYQCQHCERRFAIKAGLDQHLAIHQEGKPFLCDTCGFSTKHQSHLLSHKRIHTGDVFHCNFPNCTYSTPRKSQLESHHRTHTAIRSHMCAICGKAFIEKSHLVRHERIHLEEKPFKCELCDYSSARKDKVTEHFKKQHGENSTTEGPSRPKKQKKQNASVHSPTTAKAQTESVNQLPTQDVELQTAVSAITTNNPVVYSYGVPHPEVLHSHAAVALQEFGAASTHNYQVGFMEDRHQQPHHSHNPHVQSTLPYGVPGMVPAGQNQLHAMAANLHDGANVVDQPPEFSPYIIRF